ncbi:hypothetical protein [Maritalea sp.]|jgi:hypothetical protein|uniref:hypothetical protein n=1 Tax=Maritalea sp. TaxID=2003361 RepID=UPI0039E71138
MKSDVFSNVWIVTAASVLALLVIIFLYFEYVSPFLEKQNFSDEQISFYEVLKNHSFRGEENRRGADFTLEFAKAYSSHISDPVELIKVLLAHGYDIQAGAKRDKQGNLIVVDTAIFLNRRLHYNLSGSFRREAVHVSLFLNENSETPVSFLLSNNTRFFRISL